MVVAGCGGGAKTEEKKAEAPAAPVSAGYQVRAYYGTYDVATKKAGLPAGSLGEGKVEDWKLPAKANKPYTIGVSFPHMKDPYWLAVNYGVIDEAKKLGVGVELVAAEGYNDLTGQINQVENLAGRNVNGIILGGISYASQDQLVESISAKIPVVEVINDIQAAKIAGKTLVSFYDMGYEAGRFVAEDSKDKQSVTVAFLPGPAGSGWAPDTVDGFKAAVEQFAKGRIKMLEPKWGDTGKAAQQALIEDAVNANPDLDYLVGNAVAADAAPDVLANRSKKPKVVSTYIIPPLFDKIKEGKVAAAPSDFTAVQGRMAVDFMVRLLNGEKAGTDMPFRAGPIIKVVTPKNYQEFKYEDMFGPADWKPVFSVKAKE